MSLNDNTEFEMCECVSLISVDHLPVFTRMPKFAGNKDCKTDFGAEGQTLSYLRDGYHNYLANNPSKETHILTAYSCTAPKLKQYNMFKSVHCKSCQSMSNADRPPTDVPDTDSKRHELITVTIQYIFVFSSLTDFHFNWPIKCNMSGICNAIVVEKAWSYNESRNLYMPYYKLLAGDIYTDLVVNSMLTFRNGKPQIKSVRFVSTPTTRFYTNLHALFQDDGDSDAECTEPDSTKSRPESSPSVINHDEVCDNGCATDEVCIDQQPRKRRHLDIAEKQPSSSTDAKAGAVCTPSQPFTLRSESCPARIHTMSRDAVVEDVKPVGVKNPTLIVFKPVITCDNPDILLCNITVEIGLGKKVMY